MTDRAVGALVDGCAMMKRGIFECGSWGPRDVSVKCPRPLRWGRMYCLMWQYIYFLLGCACPDFLEQVYAVYRVENARSSNIGGG